MTLRVSEPNCPVQMQALGWRESLTTARTRGTGHGGQRGVKGGWACLPKRLFGRKCADPICPVEDGRMGCAGKCPWAVSAGRDCSGHLRS